MIASHALLLLGRAAARVSCTASGAARRPLPLLREFFRGGDALPEHAGDSEADRLHSVVLEAGTAAVGRTLAQVDLAQDRVLVTALLRGGKRNLAPAVETQLAAGDVLVLFGAPADLSTQAPKSSPRRR
jgi:monovalent cation:H+ antiporter-2, CPA2 family